MSKPFLAVSMGADSDLGTMQGSLDVLTNLQVPYEVRVATTHGTPAATDAYVKKASECGAMAAQALARSDTELAERFRPEREASAAAVIARNAALQERLGG